MPEAKKRAPTLYAIIFIKLVKGSILLSIALGVYHLAEGNRRELFEQGLRWIHLDPEKEFFADLAGQIARITDANVRWVATGTFIYSLFSLVEGIGLIFRVTWACWMAIGESAFFIPIEVFELERTFSYTLFCILIINVVIVWYLYRNRDRLFRHQH
jgi:uncharacterized membrane protein (DUF2068 family)